MSLLLLFGGAAPSTRVYLSWAKLTLPDPVHNATGTVQGPGAAVTGTAARTRAHAATGVLQAQGAAVVGSAARTRAHEASGAVAAAGSAIAGAAARTGAPIAHDASGALQGAAAAATGIAARTRVHDAEGVLEGAASALLGDARRTLEHAAEGALSGFASGLAGEADRQAHVAVTHDATGDLVGPGSAISGYDFLPSGRAGGGSLNQRQKQRRRYVITLEDRDVLVASLAEAKAVLAAYARKAPEQAKQEIAQAEQTQSDELPIPQIEASGEALDAIRGLRDEITRIQAQIDAAYAKAMRDAELAYLIGRAIEQDEEEASLLLL